ncbi:MAG: DUF2207 family protein [Armatimonadota bacterium]
MLLRFHPVRHGLLMLLPAAAFAQDRHAVVPSFLPDCLLALAAAAVAYLILWLWVGRDPRPGAIQPCNTPPKGLSPAAARFLRRAAYDHKVLAVALVDLAAKGLFGIRENDGQFVLVNHECRHPGETLRDRLADFPGSALFPDELAAAVVLLNLREEFAVTTLNQDEFKESVKRLQAKLKSRCLGRYFRLNLPHLFAGLGISLALSVAVGWHVWQLGHWLDVLRLAGGSALFFLSGCMVLFNLRPMWITVLNSPVDQIGKGYYTVFATVSTVGFAAAGTALLWPVPIPLILFMAGMLAVNLLFIHLLKAPTLVGRKLLDELEGFRAFLCGQARTMPLPDGQADITPALFERYLPYAMALDVAREWTTRCLASLNASVPGWYYGSAWREGGIPGMVLALDERLPNAIDVALLPSGEALIDEARRAHNRGVAQGIGDGHG